MLYANTQTFKPSKWAAFAWMVLNSLEPGSRRQAISWQKRGSSAYQVSPKLASCSKLGAKWPDFHCFHPTNFGQTSYSEHLKSNFAIRKKKSLIARSLRICKQVMLRVPGGSVTGHLFQQSFALHSHFRVLWTSNQVFCKGSLNGTMIWILVSTCKVFNALLDLCMDWWAMQH